MFACAFAQPAPAGALSGDAARGEKLFQACTDCHSLDQNDVGPRHRGVYGRKAGSLPDYNYSEALKSANIGSGASRSCRTLRPSCCPTAASG